jgi:hypothetical protein
MSSAGTPERESESRGAYTYFRAIETIFISLRGAPLLLAPADYHVAKKWRRQGIPLRLVERKLGEIFERRRKREGEDGKRRLVTLRYCRRVIERAWNRERELLAPGQADEPAALDVGARLSNLAAALPRTLPERGRWGERLRALAGDAEEVEGALAELDRELLEAVREVLDPVRRADVEGRLAAALQPLAGRLPGRELERAEEYLRDQVLRQALDLPVLSLFAPEAEGSAEPPP